MDPEFVEISTSLGKLKGMIKKSDKTSYYSFQGIPYAKPPVGDLRFRAPEPYGPWDDILDATTEGNDNVQHHPFSQNLIGEEDCLYLNVYTPQIPGKPAANKAVMVWFHGGGFSKGSGSTELYGPEYLIEEDIVIVTVNYRLGALGFLSLESETVPGNAGLKDQAMALCWVRDNISSFGGDPKNVTIFGESAGGASVNYHLLSPISRELFHKAILMSGTSLCQWSLQNKPREKAIILASQLGCTSQDDEEILQFLKSVDASEIIKVQDNEHLLSEKERIQRLCLTFMPCVEVAGRGSFLPDYPRKIMERGEFSKVPVIIGITNKEGMLAVPMKQLSCDRVNRDVSVMVPCDLNITAGSKEEKALGKEILKFYIKNDTLTWDNDTILGYVDFLSDAAFNFGCESTRQLFLKHMNCPVYSYLFTYISKRNLFCFLLPTLEGPEKNIKLFGTGACHADELAHLFKPSLAKLCDIPPSDDDLVFMNKLVKSFSAFAKTGNPNCNELGVTWPADNIQNPKYLDLGKTWNVVNGTFFPKREKFWQNIYNMYSYSY